MKEHQYIYVIVRNDLSNAQKAVQSSHAVIESSRKFLPINAEHPSVIILIVKNQKKLIKISEHMDLEHVVFREPDIGNEMTAIASRPVMGDEREYFKKYQLLL